MNDIHKMGSGFKINNLLLLESTFRRINNVRFREDASKLKMDIETDVNVQGKVISVLEKVTLVQKEDDIEQFSFVVKMVGIFECIGTPSQTDYDFFGKVNGAAIIFPYIREHISSIALKAGLGSIIIPPVNFTVNQ